MPSPRFDPDLGIYVWEPCTAVALRHDAARLVLDVCADALANGAPVDRAAVHAVVGARVDQEHRGGLGRWEPDGMAGWVRGWPGNWASAKGTERPYGTAAATWALLSLLDRTGRLAPDGPPVHVLQRELFSLGLDRQGRERERPRSAGRAVRLVPHPPSVATKAGAALPVLSLHLGAPDAPQELVRAGHLVPVHAELVALLHSVRQAEYDGCLQDDVADEVAGWKEDHCILLEVAAVRRWARRRQPGVATEARLAARDLVTGIDALLRLLGDLQVLFDQKRWPCWAHEAYDDVVGNDRLLDDEDVAIIEDELARAGIGESWWTTRDDLLDGCTPDEALWSSCLHHRVLDVLFRRTDPEWYRPIDARMLQW